MSISILLERSINIVILNIDVEIVNMKMRINFRDLVVVSISIVIGSG